MPNARDVPMRLVPSRTREDETNHFSPARNLRTKPHRRPVGEDSRPLPYRTKYSLREECRLFLVPLSYRARLVDFAVHLSPQRKESPPPSFNHSVPSSCHSASPGKSKSCSSTRISEKRSTGFVANPPHSKTGN